MSMLRIVDEETAARTIVALQQARTRCVSPVVALDQAGLLVTDDLACQIRHDVLVNTSAAVRNTRVKSLIEARLMPKDPTPAVVVKAVADRLEYLADLAKKGEFR